MRVLLVSNIYPTEHSPGGGVFLSQRIDSYRAAGHTVIPVAIGVFPDSLPAQMVAKLRYKKSPSRVIGGFKDFRLSVGLREWIRITRGRFSMEAVSKVSETIYASLGSDFDVVHAHGMYSLPAGAVAVSLAKRTGRVSAITLHGSDVNAVMPKAPALNREVLSETDRIICVSESLRYQLRESRLIDPSARVDVINNGYDPTHFYPKQDSVTELRVAYIGALRQVKGADRLPDIVARVRERVPGVAFDIVGDGPLRSHLETALNDSPVKFHGHVTPARVGELLRAAAVTVLPSRNEGFPCLVSESLACHTPVVGTDAGGIPEAVGDHRYIVPQGDGLTDRFADKIVAVLEENLVRDDWGVVTRGRTWDGIADAELRIHAELLIEGADRHPRPSQEGQ